jgi:hypothetical protein
VTTRPLGAVSAGVPSPDERPQATAAPATRTKPIAAMSSAPRRDWDLIEPFSPLWTWPLSTICPSARSGGESQS